MGRMPDRIALRGDAQRNRARILAAAEAVFTEHGASASTEQVARRAGVAIGTVFRHFPTKKDLLEAIMKGLLQRLTERAGELVDRGDPADGLFAFFRHVVAESAAKKSVVDLLSQAGTEIAPARAVAGLRQAVETLLTRAQRAGAVRADLRIAEAMALLSATSEGALRGAWDPDLQDGVLAVVFDGLRPLTR